jgi:hypothetical protein
MTRSASRLPPPPSGISLVHPRERSRRGSAPTGRVRRIRSHLEEHAASAAYLTVSEIFPLEVRALAIAVFYAIATAAGGVLAPWLFGALIGTARR